jgi:DNA-binding GntR family transcriptional regulator
VGAPVMRFERELRLGDRQVREYGFSHCRGDRLAFAMSDGSFAAAAVAR